MRKQINNYNPRRKRKKKKKSKVKLHKEENERGGVTVSKQDLLASLNELNSKELPRPLISDQLGNPKVTRPNIFDNLIPLHCRRN